MTLGAPFMTETQPKSAEPKLVAIERLLGSEPCFTVSGGSPRLRITDNYQYAPLNELKEGTRDALASVIQKTHAEGFLLPRDNSSFSIVPIHGPLRSVIERATAGISWDEAISSAPAADLKALLTHSVLGLQLSNRVVSGPAAHVLLTSKEANVIPDALTTDPISFAALEHASRLPLTGPTPITFRLYSYNSRPRFKSRLLQDVTDGVLRTVETDWKGVFKVREPSPDNPAWYLFDKVRPEGRQHSGGHNAKIYVSPTIADVPRCLSRLVEILPSLDFETWKIGRSSYGIARPDKICVYFNSLELAHSAAQVLVRELGDIEAQGVPFTQWIDPFGLISIGMDPPRPASVSRLAIPNSWRLWVARKMASAISLAKVSPDYPLPPEQAALWAMHLLGVNPQSWIVQDQNFWRN
ncbi:MAG: hypothetical protein RL518_1336 [Pseudomonadota bacterium]